MAVDRAGDGAGDAAAADSVIAGDSVADSGGLSLIVMSGDYERVHYALALAAAARAVGRPALLFFTNAALRALAVDADGTPGWHAMPADAAAAGAQALAALVGDPGAGETGAERDAALRARGVGDFETLFAACVELGAGFIVCEMGLRAIGLAPAALRRDAPLRQAGIVTLLDETGPGMRLLTV